MSDLSGSPPKPMIQPNAISLSIRSARRTKPMIYLDILRALQKEGGRLKKTHIVYRANLTHTRLDNYLDFLIASGLVREEKSGRQKVYAITKKGASFLHETNKLKEISDAFGVPVY